MLRETISHHIELIYPANDAHTLSEKICAAFGLAPDTRTRMGDAEQKNPYSAFKQRGKGSFR